MIQALFTDLDGVVRHWENQCVDTLEASYGLPKGFFFELAFTQKLLIPAITGQQTHCEWVEKVRAVVANHIGISKATELVEAWLQAPFSIDKPLVDDYRRLFPVAKLVLVTNATDRLHRDLNSNGIVDKFDIVVNSAEIGYAKPDFRFFERAMELVGVSSSAGLFIDDSKENIAAALEVGFKTIHFSDRQAVVMQLTEIAADQRVQEVRR